MKVRIRNEGAASEALAKVLAKNLLGCVFVTKKYYILIWEDKDTPVYGYSYFLDRTQSRDD